MRIGYHVVMSVIILNIPNGAETYLLGSFLLAVNLHFLFIKIKVEHHFVCLEAI